MLIVYASKTGQVRKFVAKLPFRVLEITEDLLVDEPFVLITYTAGFGQVPSVVSQFLKNNASYLRGVSASGNQNLGLNYAKSGDLISQLYAVPLLNKFELAGQTKDVNLFVEKVTALMQQAS